MVNISKLDFSGQHLYVGLDVHKKSWSVSILTLQFEHKTFTQPPEPSVLVNYLNRISPVQPIMPFMKPDIAGSGSTTGYKKRV